MTVAFPTNGVGPVRIQAVATVGYNPLVESVTGPSLEKGSEKVKGNQDGQQRDLFVDFLGNKTIVTEGEMEEDISFDAITSHSSDTHIKEACIVNISSGQNDPKEVRGELGQRIIGPHELATKVYVRRKEVLVSRGKAHYPQSWIQFEA